MPRSTHASWIAAVVLVFARPSRVSAAEPPSLVCRPPSCKHTYVARLVRRDSLSDFERAELFEQPANMNGHIDMVELPEVIVITEMARVIGPKDARACTQADTGTRGIKLNLRPGTKVPDLISWIASITCKRFLLPDTIPADRKRVSVVTPQLITPEEAYQLFLAALDSVGLAVEESESIPRIVEVAERKPLLTRLIHIEDVDPKELVQILERIKSERGKIALIESTGGILITDLPENVQRMMKVLVQY